MPAKNKSHSNSNLEQAMTLLIQNQAAFVSQLGGMDERFARMDERFAQMDERFARIEARTDERFARMEERIDKRFARIEERLDKIELRLEEHHQILAGLQGAILGLPEAIREKIGFKARR